MSGRFIPKHFVLHSGRFRFFSRQKIKFNLTCPTEELDRGLLLIRQRCLQYTNEELTITDNSTVVNKLVVQLAQLDAKSIGIPEHRKRIHQILADTAASLSYARFLDMVTLIQMEVPGYVLEALAGRFFYTMEIVHGAVTKQELLAWHNQVPWFWLLPIFQSAVTESVREVLKRASYSAR